MASWRALTRFEVAAAIGSFALIFLAGAVGQLAVRAGVAQKTVETVVRLAILLFFCIFAFCSIGLMLHVFVALQQRAGNGAAPMVRFLADHETGVTYAMWGFLGFGALIASPFVLRDLVGLQAPLPSSRGTLVADIGMTIDEVKQRSTFKMKEPRVMGDGSRMGVEDAVFEYKIGDSVVRFPQSRYYWLETPKGDTHIHVLNIGVTPRKLPRTEIDQFQRKIQAELFNDGWMPGHYLAKSEETVRLWSGKKTTGDGRYWRKGPTLLIFEVSRMDEEKRDEPPGSGEFILNLALRPKDHDKDLVFEPSAWPH